VLDTYNVRNALKGIIAIGRKPAGVRLDSGDLAKDSRWVRRELDRAGWSDVKIFASGDFGRIQNYRVAGPEELPSTAFGVGTALSTPGDAPHLSLIYKLVEVERRRNNPRSRQIQPFQGHLSRPQTSVSRSERER